MEAGFVKRRRKQGTASCWMRSPVGAFAPCLPVLPVLEDVPVTAVTLVSEVVCGVRQRVESHPSVVFVWFLPPPAFQLAVVADETSVQFEPCHFEFSLC